MEVEVVVVVSQYRKYLGFLLELVSRADSTAGSWELRKKQYKCVTLRVLNYLAGPRVSSAPSFL